MKKRDLSAVAQLLNAMKETVEKMERAQRKGDDAQLMRAKQELLTFQKKVDELL